MHHGGGGGKIYILDNIVNVLYVTALLTVLL